MTGTYYGSVNESLLALAPLDAARVLELGCGEGALAEAYKRRNPRAFYAAVEIHPPAAAVARGRVDHLIEGDFETLDDAELAALGPFDIVLMGDVLEHLKDPWAALRRIKALLSPEGTFVACVPNVAHWSVVGQLLTGNWRYKESGLLDRTHLRFFTMNSLADTLKESGFGLQKLRPIALQPGPEGEQLIRGISQAMTALGLDAQGFVDRSKAVQYLVCAKAAERATPPARLGMLSMAPRFMDVRGKLPALHLNSLSELSVTYGEGALDLPRAPAETPKILVQQRPSAAEEEVWFGRVGPLIAKGWVLVTELDDHPSLFEELRGVENRGVRLPLSASHAVQTSTDRLAEALSEYNPEIKAFPNAVFRLEPYRERGDGPMKVFFGALNREGFSGRVAAALRPAVEAHPEVEFVVMHDQAFFDALPTSRKTYLPAGTYAEYLAAMAGCDIALLPLSGSFGESFKSDLKFLEASGAGLASIVSPAVYEDTVREGETGLIARSVEDWPGALGRLLADPALRSRLSRAAWEYVRDERMFAYQTAARRDWYLSLWERRAELNAALIERHPGLRDVLAAAQA